MFDFTSTANDSLPGKFRNLFKPRDIFLHDGRSLRRFTIGSSAQLTAATVALALFAWLAFATVQAFTAMAAGDTVSIERQVAKMEADVAAMRAQARRHAALMERRQAFLARMVSGEADPKEMAALIPQPVGGGTPVAASYAEVAEMQAAIAEQAEAANRDRYRETVKVLRRLGVNPSRFEGRGGPLETVNADNADPRFKELFVSWQRLDQLEQGVSAIPSAHPVGGDTVNFTSGFGVRSDPFRGRAAMHGGIDLAGPIGTPIYATADGVVGRSEYNNGGYGNLVEINHGQGIQTRYGHLSRLVARPGQRVRRGELVGLMGSTGRSTGSHLHYEVRIDGRAVNPVPFMQSSSMLASLQRRNASTSALGGPTGGTR